MDETQLRRILVPQRQLDLVVRVDLVEEVIDVRSTVILDLEGDRLILAQTSPPLLASKIDQTLEATFTVPDPDQANRRRYGYQAKLLEIRPAYPIRPGAVEPVLVIEFPRQGVQATIVRLYHRVEPTANFPVKVKLPRHQGRASLVDLSLGGALISYEGLVEFKRGEEVSLDLKLPTGEVQVKGRVIRAFERRGSRYLYLGFKFVDLSTPGSRLIQLLVNEIMREELRRRSGLGRG